MKYETSCGFVAFRLEGGEPHFLLIRAHNGEWGFPKGHMEAGETEIETACRELREETGVTATPVPGFRRAIEYPVLSRPGTIKRAIYFLGRCGPEEPVCQETEVAEAVFAPREAALTRLPFENTRRILAEADAHLRDGKFAAFLESARLLQTLGITPLLYGSLGLERRTGLLLGADDIDMLVPETFVGERWPELWSLMEAAGFRLVDAHEHAFEKDGVSCAFAAIEELESFAGVPVREIPLREEAGTAFLLLSLEQYLQVYRASSRDGYRIHVRQKKDAEKIALIERLLAAR